MASLRTQTRGVTGVYGKQSQSELPWLHLLCCKLGCRTGFLQVPCTRRQQAQKRVCVRDHTQLTYENSHWLFVSFASASANNYGLPSLIATFDGHAGISIQRMMLLQNPDIRTQAYNSEFLPVFNSYVPGSARLSSPCVDLVTFELSRHTVIIVFMKYFIVVTRPQPYSRQCLSLRKIIAVHR